MNLPRREILTSGADTAGVVHAFYASAGRTICNRVRPGKEPERPLPTCDVCVEMARVFHGIDKSCPEGWLAALLEREPQAAIQRERPPDAPSASMTAADTARSSSSRSKNAALTRAEQHVLRLRADGMSVSEIAAERVVSVATIKRQLKIVYWKLGARNAAHAVGIAYQLRLLTVEDVAA